MVAVETGRRNGAVSNRDLPGAHHLIARHHAGYAAIADGDQEGFFRYGWQVQHAIYRVRQRNALALQGIALRLQFHHIARHFRGFAQQDVQRHINRAVIKVAVVQGQVLLFGGFTNHRIRRTFALTNGSKLGQLFRGHGHHIALL